MSEQTQAVLILDDDEAVRESFMYHFEDHGWRVLPAATAEEALDVLGRETPAGAVVDIRLPGMDGNDFIREVCRRNISMACVICTGSPQYRPPDDIAALPQVSEKMFAKPVVDLAELEEALRRQLEKCSLGVVQKQLPSKAAKP